MNTPTPKPRERNYIRFNQEPQEIIGRQFCLPADVSTSADWTDWGPEFETASLKHLRLTSAFEGTLSGVQS